MKTIAIMITVRGKQKATRMSMEALDNCKRVRTPIWPKESQKEHKTNSKEASSSIY